MSGARLATTASCRSTSRLPFTFHVSRRTGAVYVVAILDHAYGQIIVRAGTVPVFGARQGDGATVQLARRSPHVRRRAVALLEKTEAGRRPIRLLGVSVHNLTDGTEPEEEEGPQRRLPFEP